MDNRAEQPLLVGVVDDDDVYRDYVARLLEVAGVTVFQAGNGAELLALLDRQELDCILLDYNLGAETGLGINQQVRKLRDPPPIVMLTGEGRDQTIVKAFRSGMSDFLSKQNLSRDGALRAIKDAVARKAEERAQRSELERLKRDASRDHLTGLYTREFMDERLAMVTADALRAGSGYAVIIVDLIGTRSINERLGYVAGDRAIAALATRLLKLRRDKDVCARYEGDDFLYLIDGSPELRQVTSVCQTLADGLQIDLHYETADVKLQAALGAAMFPLHGTDVPSVVDAARTALRSAIRSGAPFAVAESQGSFPAAADRNAPAPRVEQPSPGASLEPRTADMSFRQVERRGERRQRVLQRGQIVLRDLMSVIDCTIRDISGGGARLKLTGYIALPDRFELVLQKTGERKQVELIWHNGDELGVRFLN